MNSSYQFVQPGYYPQQAAYIPPATGATPYGAAPPATWQQPPTTTAPPKKPDVQPWSRCDTCNMNFVSEKNFSVHIRGMIHMQNAMNRGMIHTVTTKTEPEPPRRYPPADKPTKEPARRPPESSMKPPYHHCPLCSTQCSGQQSFFDHICGKKHELAVKKALIVGTKVADYLVPAALKGVEPLDDRLVPPKMRETSPPRSRSSARPQRNRTPPPRHPPPKRARTPPKRDRSRSPVRPTKTANLAPAKDEKPVSSKDVMMNKVLEQQNELLMNLLGQVASGKLEKDQVNTLLGAIGRAPSPESKKGEAAPTVQKKETASLGKKEESSPLDKKKEPNSSSSKPKLEEVKKSTFKPPPIPDPVKRDAWEEYYAKYRGEYDDEILWTYFKEYWDQVEQERKEEKRSVVAVSQDKDDRQVITQPQMVTEAVQVEGAKPSQPTGSTVKDKDYRHAFARGQMPSKPIESAAKSKDTSLQTGKQVPPQSHDADYRSKQTSNQSNKGKKQPPWTKKEQPRQGPLTKGRDNSRQPQTLSSNEPGREFQGPVTPQLPDARSTQQRGRRANWSGNKKGNWQSRPTDHLDTPRQESGRGSYRGRRGGRGRGSWSNRSPPGKRPNSSVVARDSDYRPQERDTDFRSSTRSKWDQDPPPEYRSERSSSKQTRDTDFRSNRSGSKQGRDADYGSGKKDFDHRSDRNQTIDDRSKRSVSNRDADYRSSRNEPRPVDYSPDKNRRRQPDFDYRGKKDADYRAPGGKGPRNPSYRAPQGVAEPRQAPGRTLDERFPIGISLIPLVRPNHPALALVWDRGTLYQKQFIQFINALPEVVHLMSSIPGDALQLFGVNLPNIARAVQSFFMNNIESLTAVDERSRVNGLSERDHLLMIFVANRPTLNAFDVAASLQEFVVLDSGMVPVAVPM